MPDIQNKVRPERVIEDFVVCRVDDVPLGGSHHVVADGREFVIFNREGRLHAYRNECPHQGAPIACGVITGAMKPTAPGEDYEYGSEGDYVACPRHRWKFSIETGESIYGVDPRRLSSVEIKMDGAAVILSLRRRQPRTG